MTNGAARVRADAARDARWAWAIGGGLLVAYVALPLVLRGLPVMGFSYVTNSLWALSLLLFAFGIRGSGSVVGRRPSAVVALVVAAVVPLAVELAVRLATPSTPLPGIGLVPMPPNAPAALAHDSSASDSAWAVVTIVGQTASILLFITPLLAAFMIGRAAALPQRARWVLLIVVGCGAGLAVVGEVVAVAVPPGQNVAGLFWISQLASILMTLGWLLLGVLAAAFAPRASALLGESATPAETAVAAD